MAMSGMIYKPTGLLTKPLGDVSDTGTHRSSCVIDGMYCTTLTIV